MIVASIEMSDEHFLPNSFAHSEKNCTFAIYGPVSYTFSLIVQIGRITAALLCTHLLNIKYIKVWDIQTSYLPPKF